MESSSLLARIVRNVVDAMTGTPSIIAGLFLYLIWVAPLKNSPYAKSGLVAGLALSVLMLPLVTQGRARGDPHRAGIAARGGAGSGSAPVEGGPSGRPPDGRVGLITAAILGVANAGETAEVLFTAGGTAITTGTR